MKLPENFKSEIARAFYDKKAGLFRYLTLDDEGEVTKGPLTYLETITGNIQMSDGSLQFQEYGLVQQGDLLITTESTSADQGDVIKYMGREYRVQKALIRDSHVLILAVV